jgi:tetratricopeptide (TPR) repeat protein
MGEALNALGYTYGDMGEYEKAIDVFERYAVIMPDDANPLDSMGEQYFRMGDLDKAIEKFNEALEIESTFGSELRLAYVYALKQDYAETLRLTEGFAQWAASPGIKAETYLWMGIYDFLAGKVEKAFTDLDKVDEWAENAGNQFRHVSADITRGWIYYELGELVRSEEHLQKAFDNLKEIFPDLIAVEGTLNFSMGLIDVKSEKIDSAKERLIKIEPILDQLTEMSSILRKMELEVEYNWLRAEILITEGSPDEAIEVYESIVYPPIPSLRTDVIGPDNMPFIRDTLARAYLKKGDVDGAIAAYEKMIIFDPEGQDRRLIHPKYRYLLAKLYEERDDAAKAIEQYEAFLDLWKDADPNLPELQYAKNRLVSLRSN